MGDISRRDFLQGPLAIAIASLLVQRGVSLADGPWRPGAAFGPAATADDTPNPPWDGTRYTAPYTLASSSSMSQDYFLTDDVTIDPNANLVAPFVKPDGTTAALVVTDAAISLLERDGSSSTGWSYQVLPGFTANFSHMSAIAAGLGSDGNVYAAVLAGTGDKKGTETPALYWFWWTPDLGWQWPGVLDTDVLPTSDRITAQRALDGQIYFTIWDDDGLLRLWAPQTTDLGVVFFDSIQGQSLTEPQVFWSGDAAPSIECGIGAIASSDSGNAIVWYPQLRSGTAAVFPFQDSYILDMDHLLWLGRSSGFNGPDVFGATDGVVLRMPDLSNTAVGSGDFGQIDAFYTWGPDGANSVIALSAGEVKVMLTTADGSLAPVITIEQAVADLYGPTVPSTDAAFFTVDGFGALSVLTKDADLGVWTRLPVTQPAVTALDVSTWRTQLTLQDANGIPVDNTQVVIAPDRAVSMWQTGGSLVASPSAPVTATTDSHGRVTVAFPVVELDAPQLTVTITGKDGVSTQEFQVAPDGVVHAYLGGTGSLLGKPGFSGQALLDAKGGDGQSLAPSLSSVDSASAVASAMTSCIKVGKGSVDTSATQSFAIDMSGDQPTYAESPNAADFLHLLPRNPTGGILSDLQKDLHAIEHAIRNAVTKVTHVVANFVSAAEGWVINLALDIGQTVQFAVDGIRSAITAIHGILHAIAVDIDRAVQWLRMLVDDLIAETESHAQVVQDMLRNGLPDVLNLWSTELKAAADGYFTGLADTVNSELADLSTQLSGSSLGDATGAPPEAGGDATGALVGSGSGFDASSLLNDVTHNWLLEKIEHEFDEALQGDSGVWDDTDGLVAQLIDEFGDLGDLAEDLGDLLWSAIKTVATPTSARGMSISRLIGVMQKLVDKVLQLADDTADIVASLIAVLADLIDDFLDAPIVGLPLLSAVLSKLGHSTDLTAGHVFSLIIAFPAALMHRIATGTSLPVPPLSTQASVGALGAVQDDSFASWAQWNLCIHASCRVGHVPLDLMADVIMIASGNAVTKPLRFTSLWDGVASLAVLGTTWPGAKRADGTTPRPFTTLPPTDTTVQRAAIAHWATSGLGPMIGVILWGIRAGEASGATDAPPAPEPKNPLTVPYGWWVPWANVMVFGTTMGLGLYAIIENDKLTDEERAVQIAATVLELLPRMGAPLATQYVNGPAFGLPMALKVVFDVLQAVSAGLLIDEAVTTP